MKKITLTAFLLFILLTLQAQVDIVSPGYISLKDKKMELNLPQLGVSIKLPRNMGVEFPRLSGKDVSVELDEQSYFMFDLNYLQDPNMRVFRFAMSTDEDTPLLLEIMQADNEIKDVAKNNSQNEIVKYLKNKYLKGRKTTQSIKSGIGESLGTTSDRFDVHSFYHDGYFFSFYLPNHIAPKQRNLYKNVITNFNSKNLTVKKEQYEQRVTFGYYKQNKNEKIKPIDNNTFQHFKGSLAEATIFSYPYLGMSLQIPAGFKYDVSGTAVRNDKPNTKEVTLSSIDFYNEKMIFSFYTSNKFSITTRVSEKGYSDPKESLKTQADYYKYTRWSKTSINGIPSEVAFMGLEAKGNLEFYFSLDDKDVWISVWGYSNETKDEIDRIFSTLKLANNGSENKPTKIQPLFSSLFKLKDMPPIELDKITIPIAETSDNDRWLIADLGLHFTLEGKISDYLKYENGNYIPLKSSILTMGKPENEDQNFSIMNGSYTTTLTITSDEDSQKLDQEKELKEAKYTWDGYKQISGLKASIVNINNIKWSILLYEQAGMQMSMAYTFKDGYRIMLYRTNASSIEEVYQTLGYLHTFSFK